jgi:hypothetical protein
MSSSSGHPGDSWAPDLCPGSTICSACTWVNTNGGPCDGCDDEYQRRCLKRSCYLSCARCGGGKHARVPACCGRAPASWREHWDRLLQLSAPEYNPEPVEIGCLLIPVIYAQVRQHRIPEQFPQIDAWAVPIHKVADRKGRFRSSDLKDYLGLPSRRKLILSTSAPDDYQEALWAAGGQTDYSGHGIDYWFPGHFSIYDNDSRMYQFASARRQQLHAAWTRSQFVWFRLGEHIPIQFMQPIRNAPSVLISTGQMLTTRNRQILGQEISRADAWFPADTAFFIVGGRRDLPVSDERKCYRFDTNWLMRGLRGYNLARQKIDEKTPRRQLLISNLSEVLDVVHPTA